MKKVVIVLFAGAALLALKIYALDNAKGTEKNELSAQSRPALAPAAFEPQVAEPRPAQPISTYTKPIGFQENEFVPQARPEAIEARPESRLERPLIATEPNLRPAVEPVLKPAAPVASPAVNNSSPTMNFQMEMAKIHQEIFSIFNQNELMEISKAIEEAFNGALATDDFDKAISKLELAITDLAKSFAKNIELNQALNTKLKSALKTASDKFEALVRSGKISNLSGEAYLARIMKAAISGLSNGFNLAKVANATSFPVAPVATTTPASLPRPGLNQTAEASRMPIEEFKTSPIRPSEPVRSFEPITAETKRV